MACESQMTCESQLSFFSQPSQLVDLDSEFLAQDDTSQSSTPKKGWINEHYDVVVKNGVKWRYCMAEGCKKVYMGNISHRSFKSHWTKEHPQDEVPLKKTRFLFHDKLHVNRLVKAVIDLRWDFSVVDKQAFKLLLQAYNVNKNHICRKTLSYIIAGNRRKLSIKVTEKLANAVSVALTFDIWSARKGSRGFGCLTAHYINSDWQLVNLILNFKRMKFPHDGNAIYKFISRSISEFKLEGRVIAITTDSASNNIAAIKLLRNSISSTPLDVEFVHCRCIAHVIDLGVREAMKELENTVKPVREAVLAIRSSQKRKETFIEAQQTMIEKGIQTTNSPLELADDVEHRWNSLLILIERAAQLQKAIDLMLGTCKAMAAMDQIDWTLLDIVIKFLKPFQLATQSCCTASNASATVVSKLVPKLVDHCVQYENNENISIKNAARSMRSKLTDYECEIYNPMINLACALDPRCKTRNLSNEMIRLVTSHLRKLFDEVPEPDSMLSTENSILCDESDEEEPIDELESYSNSRRVKSSSSVLVWWRNNESQYPKLSFIARRILPIQATSVASERVFSLAGGVDNKVRNRLSDESVECIVLYKSWMQYLNIE